MMLLLLAMLAGCVTPDDDGPPRGYFEGTCAAEGDAFVIPGPTWEDCRVRARACFLEGPCIHDDAHLNTDTWEWEYACDDPLGDFFAVATWEFCLEGL